MSAFLVIVQTTAYKLFIFSDKLSLGTTLIGNCSLPLSKNIENNFILVKWHLRILVKWIYIVNFVLNRPTNF
jgi:hypothetical protein